MSAEQKNCFYYGTPFSRRAFFLLVFTLLNLSLNFDEKKDRIPLTKKNLLNLCRDLNERIDRESQTEAEIEIFPDTNYGPVANVSFPDGKIRCYCLNEGSFKEPIFKDSGLVCYYDQDEKVLKLYDGLNPNFDQPVGFVNFQGEAHFFNPAFPK